MNEKYFAKNELENFHGNKKHKSHSHLHRADDSIQLDRRAGIRLSAAKRDKTQKFPPHKMPPPTHLIKMQGAAFTYFYRIRAACDFTKILHVTYTLLIFYIFLKR